MSDASIWFDEDQKRFFLIPTNVELNAGNFAVKNLSGFSVKIALEDLVPYELGREEAIPYIQDSLKETMQQSGKAYALLESIAAGKVQGGEEVQTEELDHEAIATEEEVIETAQDVVEEEQNEEEKEIELEWGDIQHILVDLFSGIGASFKGAFSDNPEDLESAKSKMAELNAFLQAKGIDLEDDLVSFPDKLKGEQSENANEEPKSENDEQDKLLAESFDSVKVAFQELVDTFKDAASELGELVSDFVEELEDDPNTKGKKTNANMSVVKDNEEEIGNEGEEEE